MVRKERDFAAEEALDISKGQASELWISPAKIRLSMKSFILANAADLYSFLGLFIFNSYARLHFDGEARIAFHWHSYVPVKPWTQSLSIETPFG